MAGALATLTLVVCAAVCCAVAGRVARRRAAVPQTATGQLKMSLGRRVPKQEQEQAKIEKKVQRSALMGGKDDEDEEL